MSKSTRLQKIKAALSFAHRGGKFLHTVGVAGCGDVVFHAAAIVDVVNFADAEDGHGALFEHVEQHRLRRLDGVVVPARRPHKISSRPGERPRDHAADSIRPIQNFSRDFAHAIQLIDWNDVFMRGDLKDAVARRVDDRLARFERALRRVL